MTQREDYIKDVHERQNANNMSDKKPHMKNDRLCDLAASDKSTQKSQM